MKDVHVMLLSCWFVIFIIILFLYSVQATQNQLFRQDAARTM